MNESKLRKEVKMSPKDRSFKMRLEEKDYLKLIEEAEKAGFQNVSEFVRYLTIGEGRKIQSDLKEILDILKNPK
jgi:hypothetical protein